jgi:hypothetical protein
MIQGFYVCFLALLFVVTASVQAQQASAIAVGSRFPRIEGKSLAGTRVVAPDDFKGKVTLITAAFVEPAQQQIDTWAKPTLAKYLDNPKVGYLELPILSKGAEFFGLGSAWIDGGMRSGIDPKLHGSVMTLYTDLEPYYTMMGPDKKAAYIFLLNAEGTVIGRWVGAAKPGDVEALHGQINTLLAAARTN